MEPRVLRERTIWEINSHLRELARLRTKIGYTKIKPAKKAKLRQRVRWQLGWLRKYLPKIKGVAHPCDPDTWKIREITKKELADARATFMLMHTLGSNHKGF